jgi:RNA polymerase-binding transcription factor DksA
MNISELEKRLREKERELWADMKGTEEEARVAGVAETQDGAAAAESKETLFRKTTSDWNTFTEVRDALQRIAKGAYGKCVDCGRQIEDHRLESVPWTAYCLAHQNRHEREAVERPL